MTSNPSLLYAATRSRFAQKQAKHVYEDSAKLRRITCATSNMIRQGIWLLFVVAVGGFVDDDELTPDVLEARRSVSDANNAFSIDLYQAIKSQPGNLIVSPFSAGAVLALVLQGAGGKTAQELQRTLRLPSDEEKVRKGYSSFFDSLRSTNEVIVRIANKVYAAKGSHLKAPFRQSAVQSFQAEAQELDFARKTEESRQKMNSWVEEITDNKIQNLITDLDPATVMVLINAIYFKGSWVKQFEEEATQPEPFHLTRTSQVNVSMMHNQDKFSYGRIPSLNARAIELPYQGYKMKMLIILPDEIDGLPAVENGLNTINFTQLSREMEYGEVILSLPKFKIESTYQLHETLPQMGINDLFIPGACNLTGITDQQVVVSKVVQKAFVEVTETGTVAAAATGVVGVATSWIQNPPPPKIFTVDRPFLFVLMHKDRTLFVGRVTRPEM